MLLGNPVRRASQSGLVLVTADTQAKMDLIAVGAAVGMTSSPCSRALKHFVPMAR